MLTRDDGATYAELRERFAWRIPPRLNIGLACSDFQTPGDLALVDYGGPGVREYTFGDLTTSSNRLANALRGIGIRSGDRVGIVLPQRAEAGIAHLALYKMGAVAVPMSTLFGPQALAYRLGDCGARAVIADPGVLDALDELRGELPELMTIVVGEARAPHLCYQRLVEDGGREFKAAETAPATPALLIYTSGTTGAPKGALHGHRVLLGHLPGFGLSHNFLPREGDRFWTPADWAWIGGLMDGLMPAWFCGVPVIAATRQRFDPEWATRLMADHGVRNAFLPPTALKMMRQAGISNAGLRLRSLMCGGEPLGEEMLQWAERHLGVTVNEIYGQTEANYVVGNCAEVWPVRPGSMGRPYPGHDVALIDEEGHRVVSGSEGEIAVSATDPVVFLRYWENPTATTAKLTADGRWVRTGDLGHCDDAGYIWFHSRADDVINSAGYRIGPAEIEECVMHHPAVALVAAIGVPDDLRGEVVKAVIQLADGFAASEEIEEEIRRHVRDRLAAYEYPRQIEFVDDLPLTTTGKIQRRILRERHLAGETEPGASSRS